MVNLAHEISVGWILVIIVVPTVADFKKEKDSDHEPERMLRASSEVSAHTSMQSNPPTPSRRDKVGRSLGPQPKRKAVEDVSENAHTKRSRQRAGNFTEDEEKVERAKQADIAALTYAVKTAKQKDPTVSDTAVEEIRQRMFEEKVNPFGASSTKKVHKECEPVLQRILIAETHLPVTIAQMFSYLHTTAIADTCLICSSLNTTGRRGKPVSERASCRCHQPFGDQRTSD